MPGRADELNQPLEKAYRLASFVKLDELMCVDALHRRESCRGHFHAESQIEEGKAKHNDKNFLHIAVWECGGRPDAAPILHKEDLTYKSIQLKQRDRK